jgi:hypothetical protein
MPGDRDTQSVLAASLPPGGVSRTHPVEVIPAGFCLEAAMHRRDNDASDQLIEPAGSLA